MASLRCFKTAGTPAARSFSDGLRGRRWSRASTTSATRTSRRLGGRRARPNAARSASPATTLARRRSWRMSSSVWATTQSGWTAWVPAGSSSQAARSLALCCAGPNSSRLSASRRHRARGVHMATQASDPVSESEGESSKFPLVFGLDTFGDVTHDAEDRPLSHAQTIRNVVEEGVLAEQVGVDFFGIGEHHTDDFPMPAADVVLAAIAARTTRIHVGSAVTVLSSDDPVRVFQRFSTLNAISNGRAEVILGRGSGIDAFPLFGYDLADYEDLFEEKVNLFAELLKGAPVTWQGKTRPLLSNQHVVPHT